jgi:hypothetical protein
MANTDATFFGDPGNARAMESLLNEVNLSAVQNFSNATLTFRS